MAEGKGRAPRPAAAKRVPAAKKPPARKGARPNISAASRKREADARKRRTAEKKRVAEEKRLAGELDLARDGVTAAQKTIESAEVYLAIFKDWTRGFDYAALSATHGLGIRRCKQIVTELRGSRLKVMQVNDPMFGLRTAQDMVLHWTTAISDYAELAGNTSNEHIKLGAMRDRDRAMGQFLSLMQELGLLPKHLGTLKVQADLVAFADAMLDALEAADVDEQVISSVIELMDLRVRSTTQGLVLDLGAGAFGDDDAIEGTARDAA